MNTLIGKVLTVKGKITETLINSISDKMNIKPEEVTIEHFRQSMKESCTEGEYVSCEVE